MEKQVCVCVRYSMCEWGREQKSWEGSQPSEVACSSVYVQTLRQVDSPYAAIQLSGFVQTLHYWFGYV